MEKTVAVISFEKTFSKRDKSPKKSNCYVALNMVLKVNCNATLPCLSVQQ